jgi:hypothetical protein
MTKRSTLVKSKVFETAAGRDEDINAEPVRVFKRCQAHSTSSRMQQEALSPTQLCAAEGKMHCTPRHRQRTCRFKRGRHGLPCDQSGIGSCHRSQWRLYDAKHGPPRHQAPHTEPALDGDARAIAFKPWHIAGVLTKHVEHIPKVEADCSNLKDDLVAGCQGGH